MNKQTLIQNLEQTLTEALQMGGYDTEAELVAYAHQINSNAPDESVLDSDDVEAVARQVWADRPQDLLSILEGKDDAPAARRSVQVKDGSWPYVADAQPRPASSTPAGTSATFAPTKVRTPFGVVYQQRSHAGTQDKTRWYAPAWTGTDAALAAAVQALIDGANDASDSGHISWKLSPSGAWEYGDDSCRATVVGETVSVSTAYILGTWSDMVFGGHVRWHSAEEMKLETFLSGFYKPGPTRAAIAAYTRQFGLSVTPAAK